MDIASVFEWFAQESISIAVQAAEPEQREKLAELALLWASVATVQRRSTGDAIYSSIVSWSARTPRLRRLLSGEDGG
jgi:hypothetical protein